MSPLTDRENLISLFPRRGIEEKRVSCEQNNQPKGGAMFSK